MKHHRSALIALLAACAALAAAADANTFKIVAHPSVPVASLSRAAVSAAFLKKTDKWPDGTAIVPVDQAHDSSVRHAFCRQIHDRSLAVVDAFWQKQVFSGRATPPLTKPNDAEVIAYVRSVPGAIGYVSTSTESTGLKEIRVQ